MNNSIYQNTERVVITFLSDLTERAIEPYSSQIEGTFKLENLRKRLVKTLKDTVSLITAWGFESDIPNKDARMRDATALCARRMCAHINEEVFALFEENTKDTFFMIDFMVFSNKVGDLLFKELTSMEDRGKYFLKN